MAIHNDLGIKGENIACNYLENKGYQILEKNYRYKKSEIDIIALQDNCIVFVEVKTRRNAIFDIPENAITRKKMDKLQEGALYYIEMNNISNELRFDIITIITENNQVEINHIENAFWN